MPQVTRLFPNVSITHKIKKWAKNWSNSIPRARNTNICMKAKMRHSKKTSTYVNNNSWIFIWIFEKNQSADKLDIDVENNHVVILFLTAFGVSEDLKICLPQKYLRYTKKIFLSFYFFNPLNTKKVSLENFRMHI